MGNRDYSFLHEIVRERFKIRYIFTVPYGNYKSLIRCRVVRVLKTLEFQKSHFKALQLLEIVWSLKVLDI